MDNLIFLDTETTGLDPDFHQIWEVGAIEGDGTEHHWFLPVDLGFRRNFPSNERTGIGADLIALNIGGFFDRYPLNELTYILTYITEHWISGIDLAEDYKPTLWKKITRLEHFARDFMKLTQGKHLVGAIPSFDAQRLEKLLRYQNCIAAWHYHLIDVEALVAGKYKIQPPWDSKTLLANTGLEQDEKEKHTALGDAKFYCEVYKKVMEL
jgi:hypothetical protein